MNEHASPLAILAATVAAAMALVVVFLGAAAGAVADAPSSVAGSAVSAVAGALGSLGGGLSGVLGGTGRVLPLSDPLVPAGLEPVFADAAQSSGVPEALLLAVAAQGSGFDPDARSSDGAVGVMQMDPSTFAAWAPRAGFPAGADALDPRVEVPVAAALLAAGGARLGGDARAPLLTFRGDKGYVRAVLVREADYAAWLGGPVHTGRPEVTGWPWGQCTWYVAQRRAEAGAPVTWSGDARQWLAAAQAQGLPTTTMPRPGEIAVYRRGGGYDAVDGHVAFVVAVTDTSYTVAEANVHALGVVDTRTLGWPDEHVAGFIP